MFREKHNVQAEFPGDFIKGGGAGGNPAAEVMKNVSKHQLIYSLVGLGCALGCILGGIVLFFGGVVGNTTWVINILGAESNLSDAAPGAVLFVVGLFVAFVTRYKYKVTHP